eukprot:GILK01009587.1.p1 GENE.GILK01009587.1~~GILK01009587.1.p1  ORF type:complete len:546 (+),score=99.12 GILK01009587.1:1657-3294(+)
MSRKMTLQVDMKALAEERRAAQLMPPPTFIPIRKPATSTPAANATADSAPNAAKTAPNASSNRMSFDTSEKGTWKVPGKTVDEQVSMFVAALEDLVRQPEEEELSTPWQEVADPDSKDVYYWNTETQQTTWEQPPEYAEYKLKLKAQEERRQRQKKEERKRKIEALKMKVEQEEREQNARRQQELSHQEQTALLIEHPSPSTVGSVTVKQEPADGVAAGEEKVKRKREEEDDSVKDSLPKRNKRESHPNKSELLAALIMFRDKLSPLLARANKLSGKAKTASDVNLVLKEADTLLIQLDTRIKDYREGALDGSYLATRLEEMNSEHDRLASKIKDIEATPLVVASSAPVISPEVLPSGWIQLLDANTSATYYANVNTGETSWQIPTVGVSVTAAPASLAPAAVEYSYSAESSADATVSSARISELEENTKRKRAPITTTSLGSKNKGLLAKWATVQKQLTEEERRMQLEEDHEYQRQKGREAWHKEQSSRDSSNPNFTPIPHHGTTAARTVAAASTPTIGNSLSNAAESNWKDRVARARHVAKLG